MADLEDFDFGDNVDLATFEQILEMDDDPKDPEFSKSIVFGFFDQAEETFSEMDTKLEEKDLLALSHLGHFLKGSSATLGFGKVRDQCEKIQHYGDHKDETGTVEELDDAKLLILIGECLLEAKQAYSIVHALMREYYEKLES